MTTRKGREFKVGEVVLKMTDIDEPEYFGPEDMTLFQESGYVTQS